MDMTHHPDPIWWHIVKIRQVHSSEAIFLLNETLEYNRFYSIGSSNLKPVRSHYVAPKMSPLSGQGSPKQQKESTFISRLVSLIGFRNGPMAQETSPFCPLLKPRWSIYRIGIFLMPFFVLISLPVTESKIYNQ